MLGLKFLRCQPLSDLADEDLPVLRIPPNNRPSPADVNGRLRFDNLWICVLGLNDMSNIDFDFSL